GAPGLIVRRCTMRLERRHVLVDLVEVIDVLILLVLENVEPEATRLIALGAERVDLDRLEETLLLVRLHAHFHPDRKHRDLLRDARLDRPLAHAGWYREVLFCVGLKQSARLARKMRVHFLRGAAAWCARVAASVVLSSREAHAIAPSFRERSRRDSRGTKDAPAEIRRVIAPRAWRNTK